MIAFGALLLQFLQVTLVVSQAKPGCQDKCGNISIPYPFGIGENCFREGFGIDCNSTNDGLVPFISGSNIDITNISLSTGEIIVNQYIARDCYNRTGFQVRNNRPTFKLRNSGIFTLSHTQNKFTVLGCDTYAYIGPPYDDPDFQTGCRTICKEPNMVIDGSCSGIGCCQTSIPKGVKKMMIVIQSFNNHTNVSSFNPCGYAFLADLNWFKFHGLSDLLSKFYEKNNGEAPLVLDWAVGNQTCEEAQRAPNSDHACVSENSYCYDSTNGPGYRCNCSVGCLGNPYLHGGCVCGS
ncbi:Wall-associated receptor kinase 5 [Acorus gramineus]|uniref:Wall-associated receptor kinase 5 n=1 Tax=Acorus gramineus TaxID=55184 RepID=A0AAV9ATI9_ACOGR|nr:Wall-associated receptor kinase 5 [Acorus gramineus]